MKKFLVFGISILIFGCGGGGGGGGGGGEEKAELIIKIENDCSGKTECIDVFLDGGKIFSSLKPGDEKRKTVSKGNHILYLSGSCELNFEWGPKNIYISDNEHREVFNCSFENKGFFLLKCDDLCKGFIKKIDFYLNDFFKKSLSPAEEWKGYLTNGVHKIFGISEKGIKWGPKYITIEGGEKKENFSCENTKKSYLSISLTENCSCSFIYGVRIYYTEPPSEEYLLFASLNPGQSAQKEILVGYHKIYAEALCYQDNLKYKFGPIEIYLPEEGLNYIISCFELKP